MTLTVNAYIFSWDQEGVEAIVPITQYEEIDGENILRILRDEPEIRNPINDIIRNLILRAQYNTQRHYEIYAVDCEPDLDVEWWRDQWERYPQETADLIRERGQKIYSDRVDKKRIKIT